MAAMSSQLAIAAGVPAVSASERAELLRLQVGKNLNAQQQARHGQFFTPAPIARMMAGMFGPAGARVRILDAGAGVGSLFSACVDELCAREQRPEAIEVVAYEIDPMLCSVLDETMGACGEACGRRGISFRGSIREEDFVRAAIDNTEADLFTTGAGERFDWGILNPPYYKIAADSRSRKLLERLGLATSNIYSGFLAAAMRQLAPTGELVAITPRSFCNGPYFRDFRKMLLGRMTLSRLHVFESRRNAFRDHDVLQENVILHAVRGQPAGSVQVTSSNGPDDDYILSRQAPHGEVVRPSDPDCFIRLLPDQLEQEFADIVERFEHTLGELGMEVSTGRVVGFRAQEYLRSECDNNAVPLLHPRNLVRGRIEWPRLPTKKPIAIARVEATRDLLVPNDWYVLVKRFSAKEERRRVVAAVIDPASAPGDVIGFENHVNYFHRRGAGLPPALARGLALFLNSTLVDRYFRQFSGHTQVNATDLRNLKYPAADALEALGRQATDGGLEQTTIDQLVGKLSAPKRRSWNGDPVLKMARIDEALDVLKQLGFPRQQLNERSALTLLALLSLTPDRSWRDASDELWGITPMMDFFAEHYGKRYKPNTRESVRRMTIHQFLDAGLVVANPDRPERPVNSGKSVYKIEANALKTLRTYGSTRWTKHVKAYLATVDTLKSKYAREREMKRIPVKLPGGKTLSISPGGQNLLLKQIVEEFAPRFTPGGRVIYLGDADDKQICSDVAALRKLGVDLDVHGKMPDAVIHYKKKGWLVLVEAVTSHGPVNPKRRAELEKLFSSADGGLVFVTAFLNRKTMIAYLNDISWETEVWVAESPSHMIHFNGERFLGPY